MYQYQCETIETNVNQLESIEITYESIQFISQSTCIYHYINKHDKSK